MKLSLSFSTCPNDTFMFDAMVHGKIDTEGLSFNITMADVEELNRKAFIENVDITKLSYHAYAYVAGSYQLLDSGSALGFQNGPLLISKDKYLIHEVPGLTVAIPGKYTTANLLFSIKYPHVKAVKELPFFEIEDAISAGNADAGVIIHENRFTYKEKGLEKIIDLGQDWEDTTGHAIPLGGIVVKRCLPLDVKQKIERVLRRSVEFAFNNPGESYGFVKKYAQELNEEVIKKHIRLYVNEFSVSLRQKGKMAIETLFNIAIKKGVINTLPSNIFV